MKVLIDHNISPHVAHAVAAMASPHGHLVVAMIDRFQPATPDLEWLGTLGREGGWAFVSNDQRIWKNPQECAALLSARVIGFFLSPGWRRMKEFDRAGRLIMWWPKLMEQVALLDPPAAFEVPVNTGSRLRSIPLPGPRRPRRS